LSEERSSERSLSVFELNLENNGQQQILIDSTAGEPLFFSTGMTFGPDNALYISNFGFGHRAVRFSISVSRKCAAQNAKLSFSTGKTLYFAF